MVCFCLVGVISSRQRRGVFFHAKKIFRRRNPIFARFAIVLNDIARSSEITRWIAPRLLCNYPQARPRDSSMTVLGVNSRAACFSHFYSHHCEINFKKKETPRAN